MNNTALIRSAGMMEAGDNRVLVWLIAQQGQSQKTCFVFFLLLFLPSIQKAYGP